MLGRATGILRKIHSFLHGLFSPPQEPEDDDLPFLDDLSWLQETDRIRQDALLFWSESSLNRYRTLSELSAPGKFYEKHSTTLSEFDLMTLNAMTAIPADTSGAEERSRDILFEPLRPGSKEPVPAETGAAAKSPPQPVMSFIDPLEDLYEPIEAGFVPVWEKKSQPYSDLYSVIMRMTPGKKQ